MIAAGFGVAGTAGLVVEGLANDALRFIQDSRKAANLDVSDRIHMVYNGDDDILNAINTYRERIMNDALIVELTTGDASQFETEIEGHKFAVQITKA